MRDTPGQRRLRERGRLAPPWAVHMGASLGKRGAGCGCRRMQRVVFVLLRVSWRNSSTPAEGVPLELAWLFLFMVLFLF